LEALLKLENEGLKIYPSPKTLKLIQNKGIQKIFIQSTLFRTAKYKRFENLKSLIETFLIQNKASFVWKCTEFGYDGNGVSD
jgi:5-(carboxyamino)imidazole ribonucleotide synthase